MSFPLWTASLMIVTPMPAPSKVMPFLTANVRVQVTVPTGMLTTSPLVAEAIAAATSDCDALFALIVVAPAKRETARIRVVASETRALTHGPGVEQRTLPSPLGSFGIHQFPALVRALNPHGCLASGKTNSWIVHGNEIEGKPERSYRSEACFCPVVQDYRREKAQSISSHLKIPKKLEAYFPECGDKQPNHEEYPNRPQVQIGFQITIMSLVW